MNNKSNKLKISSINFLEEKGRKKINSKKVSEKSFAISGIFLMIMSLFAFSVILSESVVVRAEIRCWTLDGQLKIFSSGTCASRRLLIDTKFLETPPAAASVPSQVATLVTTGTLITGGTKGTLVGQIWKNNNIDLLIKSATTEKITGINLATGKSQSFTPGKGNVFDLGKLSTTSATPLQSLTGGELAAGSPISNLLSSPTTLSDAQISALAEKGFIEVVPGESFIQNGVKHTINPVSGAITSQKVQSINVFGTTFTGISAHLLQGVFWAAGIIAAIQLLGPMFGLEEETVSAATKATIAGVATWKGIDILVQEYGQLEFFKSCTYGLSCAAWAGIAVAALVFVLLYKKQEEKIVQFTCIPWQAPTRGNSCEECNKQGILPCSEYQCKSLGQACELINKGTTEEKCVWVNRQDVNPPTIEPLEEALLDDYKYAPDNTINPPDRGVKINYLKANDNCIPAFTPLRFGVELNEPAKCKIDVLRKENFKEMRTFMSSGLLDYNHTHALSLPGKSALESANLTVQNDGNYELYVRCEDANGNSNTATFVFKYCVDPGPDTTPPLIVTTSILNNVPIAFNQSSIDLEVYINEPSQCRWSHNDQDYDSMDEQMQCATSIFEFNAQMLYKCSTTLTGLKDRTENKFFFRCKDQPTSPENERNTNAESYEFTLIGTQPLVIDSVTPYNETIKDSTDSVKVTFNVKTSSGHNEGEALCYYSDSGDENDYIKFFSTGTHEHSQDLFLTEGSYEYFIKCTDFGGNSDYNTTNFEVETDISAPLVVRAYKEENFLKLVTDEPGQCVYSTFGCNYEFNEGTKITVVDEENHFTDWNVQTNLYVKCQDDFGNRPLPNQCSITVRASDF